MFFSNYYTIDNIELNNKYTLAEYKRNFDILLKYCDIANADIIKVDIDINNYLKCLFKLKQGKLLLCGCYCLPNIRNRFLGIELMSTLKSLKKHDQCSYLEEKNFLRYRSKIKNLYYGFVKRFFAENI